MGINQIEVPEQQRSYWYTANNGTIKTPNIKRLASEGMVFQTWYSAYHLCNRLKNLTKKIQNKTKVEIKLNDNQNKQTNSFKMYL